MGLTFGAAFLPPEQSELLAGAHIRKDALEDLVNNHNKLVGEHTAGDLVSHVLTGHYTLPVYMSYQRSNTLPNATTTPFWSSVLPDRSADFTNIVVECELQAETNAFNASASVVTAGGGTSGTTAVAVGSWTACSWTIAVGSATDPIVEIRGNPAVGTAKAWMRNVRVYYQKLTSPLSAGWAAGGNALPLDTTQFAQGETLPIWLPTILNKTAVAVLEDRPRHTGFVDLYYTTSKTAALQTNATALTEVGDPLRVLPRSAKLDVWVLVEAAAVAGCAAQVRCDETADSINGFVTSTTPLASTDWVNLGTVEVEANRLNTLHLELQSTAAGTTYWYGLRLVEDFS